MAETVLLRVPAGGGAEDFVEIRLARSELATQGGRFVAAGPEPATVDGVRPALRVILGHLREGVHSPDEITMNIGLRFGGDTGFVRDTGPAAATTAVSLSWRPKPTSG